MIVSHVEDREGSLRLRASALSANDYHLWTLQWKKVYCSGITHVNEYNEVNLFTDWKWGWNHV